MEEKYTFCKYCSGKKYKPDTLGILLMIVLLGSMIISVVPIIIVLFDAIRESQKEHTILHWIMRKAGS